MPEHGDGVNYKQRLAAMRFCRIVILMDPAEEQKKKNTSLKGWWRILGE
jgi:hypothetical protein